MNKISNINEEKVKKKRNDFKIKDDNKYNELMNQLNEEKNKNKKLFEELIKEKIKELEKQLNSKNSEINNLKEYIYKNKIPSIKPGEEIIAIFFTSVNQDIHRPISCKNTDIFAKIEEKIYNEYPIYKDCNTYFTVNGNVINRFKTLKENGIKDGNTIIANIYDE